MHNSFLRLSIVGLVITLFAFGHTAATGLLSAAQATPAQATTAQATITPTLMPCPPVAAATAQASAIATQESTAPLCELLATKIEDIAGVWTWKFYGKYDAYLYFLAIGKMAYAFDLGNLKNGIYDFTTGFSFQNGQFFVTEEGCGVIGTYVAHVQKAGGKPVRLIFSLVKDTCTDRANDMLLGSDWVAPDPDSALSKTAQATAAATGSSTDVPR